MKKLLHLEWLKLKSYRTFYIFTGAWLVLILLVYWGFDRFVNQSPIDLSIAYRFPNVWYFAGYVSTWFSAIPALLMINLVSNEISFRTMRQQVTDGLSRDEFITGKLLIALSMSILTMALVWVSGTLFGFIKGQNQNWAAYLQDTLYIVRAGWVTFGMMTAALLVALLVRKSALAILVFLGVYWIIEPIAGYLWMKDLYPYFPLNSLDEFISSPFQIEQIQFGKSATPMGVSIAGIVYPLLFIAGSFKIMRSRDL
jgi:ABC-type transport system involved in multi-copper enzyme maturation permease subunit